MSDWWNALTSGDFSGALGDIGGGITDLLGGNSSAGTDVASSAASNAASDVSSQFGVDTGAFGGSTSGSFGGSSSGFTLPSPTAVGNNNLSYTPGSANPISAETLTLPDNSISGSGSPGSFGGISSILKNNGNWLLPAAGIGAAVLQNKTSSVPGQKTLNTSADSLRQQGAALMQPLATGSALPLGQQQQIQQSADAQKAAIRSQFAQMGMSGSTSETSALAAVDQSVQAQVLQDATALSSQGLSMINSADATTTSIMQVQLAKDNALTSALGQVAAAFAGVGLKSILS